MPAKAVGAGIGNFNKAKKRPAINPVIKLLISKIIILISSKTYHDANKKAKGADCPFEHECDV